ncbi:hypothetical protein PAXRUDRAFT_725222 [Paxillus rubicundulus Ve08.2h10]|uniref:Uncharacterized protein n=1 Tax=Paxillus rubicundulus Ve08.2h10 TaxID=930991 RepID=A0A0D0E7Z3_9AGAM|nr:hypothetical protein PAXRUDRAFT_725222 [Paxillus rubicundulus Ve08.2h10]
MQFVSSGRGGSGNMRPPSPDRETHPLTTAILRQHVATLTQYEMQIRKKHAESKTTVRSSPLCIRLYRLGFVAFFRSRRFWQHF